MKKRAALLAFVLTVVGACRSTEPEESDAVSVARSVATKAAPTAPHPIPDWDDCEPPASLSSEAGPEAGGAGEIGEGINDTPHPDGAFMPQVARNLTDPVDGFLRDHLALIVHRDSRFTEHFRETLREAGVQIVLTPYMAPNANAFAERFVLSTKSECLERMIFFGHCGLRRAVSAHDSADCSSITIEWPPDHERRSRHPAMPSAGFPDRKRSRSWSPAQEPCKKLVGSR